MKYINYLLLASIIIGISWYVVENYQLTSTSSNDVQGVSVTSGSQEQEITREDDNAGQVSFSATYKPSKQNTSLHVSLNTHSVDLNDVIFTDQVYIEKNGQKYQAISNNDDGDGHHRGSEMVFEKLELPFEVYGVNIAGIPERVLKFTR